MTKVTGNKKPARVVPSGASDCFAGLLTLEKLLKSIVNDRFGRRAFFLCLLLNLIENLPANCRLLHRSSV
jgi:hypothetical protein